MKGFKRLSTWKKFLISLLATTVSIVLTFGTTAIIDRKKQNAEKREMVLMVMYDMRESILGASRAEVTGKVVDEHHQREADLQRAREEGRKALGQDGVV